LPGFDFPVGGAGLLAPAPLGMIVLNTDFGLEGPYIGQVKAVLHRDAPQTFVVDLFSDLPAFEPQLAAYLLASFVSRFPDESVFLCVVDPGVGGERRGAVLRADRRWYVGPDNGLFNVIAQRAAQLQWWDISWRPQELSSTFHGRDLFAPLAAMLASGKPVPGDAVDPQSRIERDWPAELYQIVYIDHFGNAMTGIRASALQNTARLRAAGQTQGFAHARTFTDVPRRQAFWYENANGLVEIAVNQGRADAVLGLGVGMALSEA
jgi:S-adenosylmethionine hydrolase